MSSLRTLALLAAVLFTAPITTLAAQQVSGAAPSAESSAVPAGPRVSAGFSRVEPVLARDASSDRLSYSMHKDNHTIVISTLVLVLAIVILVLLIA